MIVYQCKLDQYFIGDKLFVSGNVFLVKVMVDWVIFDNNGCYEVLFLYDEVDIKCCVVRCVVVFDF